MTDNVEKTEGWNRLNKLTETSAYIIMLVGLPVYFLFEDFAGPGKGLPACVATSTILIIAIAFWDLRGRLWFWITLAILAFLHVLLIVLVPWPVVDYVYIQILPDSLVDIAIAFGCMNLLEKAMNRTVKEQGDLEDRPSTEGQP